MNTDFFLYDAERLNGLASEKTVKQGLDYFNANRVFDLDALETQVSAFVEGSRRDEPYSVTLSRTAEDQLEMQCDCDNIHEPVCKHTIAVLYAYADEFAATDMQLGSAVDEAIQERIKKGRNEVQIKQLSGDSCFGTWKASSITSTTHWKQSYQVHIRSLEQRRNYCTCPDLAGNQLGTCKHIEAVLHQLKKRPDYQALKQQGSPVSYVYLEWDSATNPQLKIHRTAHLDEELASIVDVFFEHTNIFTGRLPEDFHRFTDCIYARDDIQVGEDATRFIRTLAEDAALLLRGQEISREIIQSGGVLPGIHAKLYPYQVEGVAFLASRGRALLADDMGLGKTLQAISAASWLIQHDGVERILVACPASLKHQWGREIKKFTTHQIKIIQGGPDSRKVQYRTQAQFFIVNYELVLRDLSLISETLKPDLLILDEAQRIKNWQTKIASTIKLIPSRYAFVLTGTPLENRLVDLYSLLQVVDARVLGPLWRCMLDFHITDERGKVIGYRNLSELRKRIAPVMLRRDRSLISDQLPERTEVRLDIPMTNTQCELHDDALSSAGRLATLAKRRPLTPSEQNRLMAALQQARMACNAAGLVDKETEGSPKLDELCRLLEDLCLQSNRKAVIFSQWERMTAMVESRAKAMGLGTVRLHGGIPTNKRGELIDRFRDDDAVQLFISTDAGGVGLNLQSATVLINLDMPWNPAVLDQRIARVHRLGQKQNVQIFLFLAENSYEQQVAKLVQGKRNLFDNVISPEASEDVVGVSKRMLESIIEDLAETEKTSVTEGTGESLNETALAERKQPEQQDEAIVDAEIRHMIEQLQNEFGSRIERILGTGGGLLVVLSQVQEQDEQFAQTISACVPVAIINVVTLAGLQRLGTASPISAESQVIFAREEGATPAINPLVKQAEEKLQAAQILIDRECLAGVMELTGAAMLSATAVMAGLTHIPTIEEATIWIYSEALPQGIVTVDQAAAMVRTISLSHTSEIPDSLIHQSLEDTRLLLGRL
jgi:SNF2 domain-containing protein/helicase-like protein/SWIM zinc finger